MRKRLLCLALVLCLFAGLALPAPAADEESEMLQILAALGVMNGDQNGNLNLSQPVTRAQFAKMAVAASRAAGGTGSAAPPFSDVDSGHWASGYIAAAAEAGWLNGYPDGRFCPEQTVTLAEAVTVLEKLLGYSDGDFADGWPAPQLALARTLGLTRDVSADGGTPLIRRACARLVCNTLGAQTSSGTTYARTLGIALDADGAIDCDALVASVTRGPMVVEKAGWADALGFTPLHVYRNGAEVSLSAIQVYDVVYVSEKMSSVWAYSKTVTGTLEAVLPNTSSPDRITVSGTTYTLASPAASWSVSALGTFTAGSRVTLLLGRDDAVAGVLEADDADTILVGVVTGVGVETHVSDSGDRYTQNYLVLTATDGASHKLTPSTAPGVQPGEIVTIRQDQSGAVTVEKPAAGGLSGRVNSAGTQIGTVRLKQNVEILDVSGTVARKISPERLAGVTLTEEDVLACMMTAGGEAAKLVLRDVTGDMHNYALLTSRESASDVSGGTIYYHYVCGGVSFIYPAPAELGGEPGGVRITGSISAPTDISSLASSPVLSLDLNSVTTSAGVFPLSGSVQIYLLSDTGAQLVKAGQADLSAYRLTAWYDALPAQGGALRIITAQDP